MVGDVVIQRQTTEPAVRQIVTDFLTETPIRGDVVKVRHQQHPKEHLGVDGESPHSGGIACGGYVAHEGHFQNTIDLAEKVVLCDERLQVDNRLRP